MGPVPWKMANFNPGLSVIGEFEMDFISNDDITSVLCKHVMLLFVTTSRSENGSGKWIFFAWNWGSVFGEPGDTPPSRIPWSTPPGGEAKEFMCFASPTQSDITVSLAFICCIVYGTDIRTSSWLQSSSKLVPVLKNFTYRWFSLSSTTVVMISDVMEKKIYTILSLLLFLLLFVLYYNFLSHIYIQIINNKTKKDTKVTKLSLILYMNKRG